jgi:hypothetical protein
MWSTYFDPTEGSVGKMSSISAVCLYLRPNNIKIYDLKKHIQVTLASQVISSVQVKYADR